jgi:hypothetical protein
MRSAEIVFLIARLFAVGFLLWALRKQRTDYFFIMVFGVVISLVLNITGLAWVFGILAVLYNPLFPFPFNQSTWEIINIIVSVIILASLIFIRN